jgi:hypothetical protein
MNSVESESSLYDLNGRGSVCGEHKPCSSYDLNGRGSVCGEHKPSFIRGRVLTACSANLHPVNGNRRLMVPEHEPDHSLSLKSSLSMRGALLSRPGLI